MKKVLLSLAVVAALGMTSCGGDNEQDAMDVCACINMSKDAAKEMKEAGDDEDKLKELEEKYKKKAEECDKLAKDMGEEEFMKAAKDCK